MIGIKFIQYSTRILTVFPPYFNVFRPYFHRISTVSQHISTNFNRISTVFQRISTYFHRISTVFLLYFLLPSSFLYSNTTLSNWQSFPKKIVGSPSPLIKVPPYTIMTNQGNGVWQFSAYFIPGQTLKLKFMVSTNSTDYISELNTPKEFEVSFGTQGKVYYITNTPVGLIKITEGSNTNNAYMQVEFNWEDEPDAPTGLYVQNVQPTSAELYWTKSKELDVIGYNVYISNNYFPYYYKVNTSLITTNYFKFTNLVTGSSNSVYVSAVDVYTNMPNNESERSSIIEFIADRYITAMFYLKKRRADVSEGVYICGDTAPLDWDFSQKMVYLYNDLWYYKARFINGTKITYKYNLNKDSSEWESDFSTSSGNRELILNDIDGDNVIEINDVWSIDTINNPPPSAPTNIVAVPLNAQVQMFWTGNSELDFKNYKIYRSKNNTNNFTFVTNIYTTNFIDTGVENNTNYYYRITALDVAGYESGYSENISVTPMTNAPPIIPRGLKAIGFNHKVKLTWTPNPESDIAGYVLYRALSAYSTYSNISGLIVNTAYTDSTAGNGTNYFYKLQAVDTISQTNSGYSEIVSAEPSTNVKPEAPENLHLIFVKSGTLKIKWQANEETNISYYNVYYKKETGVVSSPVSTLNYSNYEITGLDNGYKYTVYVTAVNNKNLESDASDSISAYPVPSITDLTVKPSGTLSGAVKLTWTSPDKAGELGNPTRFIIKYSDSPITTFEDFQNANIFSDIQADIAGTEESIIVKNLGTDSPGYYFTVASVYGDEYGMSCSDSKYNVASMVVSPVLGGTFRKINSTLKVVIPNSVLPDNASALVIKNYQDMQKENDSLLNLISKANDDVKNYPSYKLINENTNNIFNIYAVDYNGDEIETKNRLTGKILLYLPFNDSNHNLLVDETEGNDNINIKTLKLFFVNEDTAQWALIQNSYVDTVDNYVIGKLSHFSGYSIFSKSPQTDLSKVAVYPNPIYKPSDSNPIIFTRLTAEAKIKIFTISGEIVKDGLKSDTTGECIWNCKNNEGADVASGVYFYYIEDGSSEPAKGKFAIIR